MSLNKRWIRAAAWSVLLFVGLFFGYASAQEEKDASASLGRLAVEYWTKRLVEKDYAFTYKLEMEKDSMPFPEYLEKAKSAEKFKYFSVTLKEVTIEGDRGVVSLGLKCSAPFLPKGFDMGLQDLWLKQSGQWRHKFLDK